MASARDCPEKRIADLLERYGEGGASSYTHPDGGTVPEVTWSYSSAHPEVAAALEDALHAFGGAVAWTIRRASAAALGCPDGEGEGYILAPAAFFDFVDQGDFSAASGGSYREHTAFYQQHREICLNAQSDLPALEKHLRAKLAADLGAPPPQWHSHNRWVRLWEAGGKTDSRLLVAAQMVEIAALVTDLDQAELEWPPLRALGRRPELVSHPDPGAAPRPWFAITPFLAAGGRDPVVVEHPACHPGDYLVCFGDLRVARVSDPAIWERAHELEPIAWGLEEGVINGGRWRDLWPLLDQAEELLPYDRLPS